MNRETQIGLKNMEVNKPEINNEIFLTATNLRQHHEYNMQTTKQDMEYGECPPLTDEEFYKLMITDGKGKINQQMVEITLKYFPELSKFLQKENSYDLNIKESIDELLARYSLPELQLS